MKRLICTILFLCCLCNFFSQDNPFGKVFPLKEGRVEYSEVITINNVEAPELYKRAKIWTVNAFKSSKDVIQNDDKDNNIIIAKGFFSGIGHNHLIKNARYWFTIRIDCRDGRYRYSISDFIYEFDVVVQGNTYHNKEDFSKWGMSTALKDKYQEALNKKFKPGKEINSNQKKEYDELKNKYTAELQNQYDALEIYYKEIDKEINSFIESLKTSMNNKEEDW